MCVRYFLKHLMFAEELGKLMYYHVLQLEDIRDQFEICYLVNDILSKRCLHSAFANVISVPLARVITQRVNIIK